MCPTSITEWREYLSEFGTQSEPATEAELRDAEQRLGTTLPPSLRNFLACSDGWPQLEGLHSATQLRWTNDPSHDLVDAWSSFEEIIALIARCLVVLDSGDGRYGLLDASRTGPDGEWRAYAWYAGDDEEPRPFPSFSAMVTALMR